MSKPKEFSIREREEFVLALLARRESFVRLCRRFKVPRATGYRWRERFVRQGRQGLRARSRRPHHSPRQLRGSWQKALRQVRHQHPGWGARKLRFRLRQLHPRVHLPSVRTLARWLGKLGLVPRRRRRQRRGPWLSPRMRRRVRRANDTWSLDFKAQVPLRDGARAEPLTIQDLKSRAVLEVRLLRANTHAAVRRALIRVFRRSGLPRAIRVDNGPPFGGGGARGLSRLAVWLRRLGLELEYGRPGHPEDNAAHEQMHGVYHRDMAKRPSANRAALQRRSDRWRVRYNQIRPHEAVGLQPPANGYHPSPRRLPERLPAWTYDRGFTTARVNAEGRVFWQGRLRFIGEAFGGEILGLRQKQTGVWEVFWGADLLGELHQRDRSSSLRASRFTT